MAVLGVYICSSTSLPPHPGHGSTTGLCHLQSGCGHLGHGLGSLSCSRYARVSSKRLFRATPDTAPNRPFPFGTTSARPRCTPCRERSAGRQERVPHRAPDPRPTLDDGRCRVSGTRLPSVPVIAGHVHCPSPVNVAPGHGGTSTRQLGPERDARSSHRRVAVLLQPVMDTAAASWGTLSADSWASPCSR